LSEAARTSEAAIPAEKANKPSSAEHCVYFAARPASLIYLRIQPIFTSACDAGLRDPVTSQGTLCRRIRGSLTSNFSVASAMKRLSRS
jgi:hypothetical protein